MREKINTALLVVITGCLLILVLKPPPPRIGRFQPLPNTTTGFLLDTQTGQWCAPHPIAKVENIPLCKDLK